MSWQDIVLSVSQVVFVIALLPSVFSKNKPAIATSVMNLIFLYVISYVYLTLSLFGSAIGIFIVATLWTVLAVQKYLINKKEKY